MSVKERLLEFLAYKNLSQSKFEKSASLSNGYVNNIRKSIAEDSLNKIGIAYPELNKGWLLTGDGQMLIAPQEGINEEDSARPISVYDPDVFAPVRIVRYKVWASFVDNFNEFNFDDVQDTVQVYLPDLNGPITEGHMVFEILGDSMETTLMEKAKVLAELVDDGNINYINGGVYIIAYRNKLVAKRVIDNDLLKNGTLTLHSDNPVRGKITILRDDIRYIWHVTDIIGSKVK